MACCLADGCYSPSPGDLFAAFSNLLGSEKPDAVYLCRLWAATPGFFVIKFVKSSVMLLVSVAMIGVSIEFICSTVVSLLSSSKSSGLMLVSS